MNRLIVIRAALCVLLSFVLAPATLAADDVAPDDGGVLQCEDTDSIDRYQLLRRLSLDLRNQLPSYEELVALDDPDLEGTVDVPEALVADMIASDAFRVTMRRFHDSLLWPNVEGVQLMSNQYRLVSGQGQGDTPLSILSAGRRTKFRGVAEGCGNFEQTEFDAAGRPDVPFTEHPQTGALFKQDGYVWVTPYWAPETQVKVCAFDAQALPTGINPGIQCATSRGPQDAGCGCGPNLRNCYGPGTTEQIWTSMREQLSLMVDDVTVGGYPYSDLITTTRTWSNGVLDFWKRHLSQMLSLNRTFDAYTPSDGDLPEDPSYVDTEWREVERERPHAGLQTVAGYSLRFQTNRGRANRFRIVFASQYFVPSSGVDSEGCDPTAEDLTQRCTCRGCHVVLEPLAAHWAEISEAGSAVIHGLDEFPVYSARCDPTSSEFQGSLFCDRFYVMEEDAYNPGTLRTHQYADIDDDLHSSISAHIDEGPLGYAEDLLGTGLFHNSIVRHVYRYLMGRDMNLDSTDPDNELGLLAELAVEFQASDDFPALVQRIVLLDAYRRVR